MLVNEMVMTLIGENNYCDGLPDDRYRYDSITVTTNASMETPETDA
jgi:hypothetical protein